MNYEGLIKRLGVPAGWSPPTELAFEDVRAIALTRDHLHDDVQGINASIDLIRRTRGGAWPTEPVTEEYNYVDLVWHECEFRDHKSFTYALYTAGGPYLGCCYLYPIGSRTKLSEKLLGYDVDVSWWVTPDAYEGGYYAMAYRALRQWVTTEFPFANVHYSNAEIPSPRHDGQGS